MTARTRRKLRRLWASVRLRAVVALSLAGFLITVVGVPLPARIVKRADRPFPCMHHACGCHDADHCWKECCCYTREQKLAWAVENHVTPPLSLAWADDEPSNHMPLDDEHEHPHPGEASTPDCPAPPHGAGSGHSCCRAGMPANSNQGPASRHSSTAQRETTPAAGSGGYVLSVHYRHCNGLPQLWSVLGAAVGPCNRVQYSFDWLVIGWLFDRSITAVSFSAPPPTPPPLG